MTITKRNHLRYLLAGILAERAGRSAELDLDAEYAAAAERDRAAFCDGDWSRVREDAARAEFDVRMRQGLPELRAALGRARPFLGAAAGVSL